MNQTQLNLLHNPKLADIIRILELEPVSTHDPMIPKIQNQINRWFTEFENPITINHSPFRSNEDIQQYIQSQKSKYGNSWCPF